ncbi:hypothetical protein ACHAXR_008244 [Thalassiosira sp. AJA248-18]
MIVLKSLVIGASIEINQEHTDDIIDTEQKSMEDKTRREYRNRIARIYKWWLKEYPDYFEEGTRVLSDDEKNDTIKFHHRNDRDIIYSGLNVDLFKAFLSFKKKKKVSASGVVTLSSVSDIKKYDDAIKWGSLRAGQPLPSDYYREVDTFILAYRKEYKIAKKEGRTDEQEADPICCSLFRCICQWAVNEGNVFVWVFSLAMWNLMSRSISVDSLAFHNIKSGASDSIKFKYDETKADKTGEFTQEKNCYANPLEPHLCFFLALGCWISLSAETLETTEKLFIKPGSKPGTASQRYCTQLSEMVMRHYEIAKHHLRVSHFNAHGIRKGSGSHASSATTMPPSFVAVAARGEWSIGKILDVYFKFAMGGDQYLGRILALLDPNDVSFEILPPHWKDPCHQSVLDGIKLTFRDVLIKHGDTIHDPTGLLSLLLASIVHHSTWLLSICSKYPDHPFHSIPILNNTALLEKLKNDHLTLEPNSHVPIPTGVPPHVSHSKAIKEVLEVCTATNESVSKFQDNLDKAVSNAVDAKVAAEGGVNMSLMQSSLAAMKKDLLDKMDSISLKKDGEAAESEDLPILETTVRNAGPFEFSYKGTNWCVPQSFMFPSGITRLHGWRKWLQGSVHIDGVKQWRIKPYRKLTGRDLHSKELKDDLKLNWRPIFTKMMEAPGLSIPTKQSHIDEAFVQSSYAMATEYLKSRFSYIFEAEDGLVNSYTIGTWSYKIKPSEVVKHGTQADIDKLPAPTAKNQQHKTKRKVTPGKRRRVRKVAKAGTGKRDTLPVESEGEGEEV